MNIRPFVRPTMLLAALFAASAIHAADFAEVYQRALLNDPLIREAEATRLAALESKPQALAALLPQLSAGAGFDNTESDGQSSFFDVNDCVTPPVPANCEPINVLSSQSGSETDTKTWNVTLRQSLFRWDNWVTLGRADRQAAQAEVDYQAGQQALILRTAER